MSGLIKEFRMTGPRISTCLTKPSSLQNRQRRLLLHPGLNQVRLVSSHTPLSSKPSSSSSSSSSSFVSDRLIVGGLLTLTGLVGVGIGTRAKFNRSDRTTEQVTKSENRSESSQDPHNLSPDESSTESPEQSAFNPDTGEINWDCPCLGGMAHGVCGEQFKAAFSCFVYSDQEPKGVECIEKFKDMQDCFKEHPDVYGPELSETEEATEEATEDDEIGTQPIESRANLTTSQDTDAKDLESVDSVAKTQSSNIPADSIS